MKQVLVVEDSPIVVKILRKLIGEINEFSPVWVDSLSDCQKALSRDNVDYFAAIVDINLPDAQDGEAVQAALNKDIPTIVLTGRFEDETRKKLFSDGIVDYVVKESRYSYIHAVKMLHRLKVNQNTSILLVEDSNQIRSYISKLLKIHLYKVFEASSGEQAIEILEKNKHMDLMISDYNMAGMNGFELVQHVRHKLHLTDMGIIGLSADAQTSIAARFIKNGANDFLHKPFLPEEFYCRIVNNIEQLELVRKVKEAANKDYLTGLNNRRFFYEKTKCNIRSNKNEVPMCACIVDIDYFKRFNDEYGHDVGDLVLIYFAQHLEKNLEEFLCARFGGEEFAIFFNGKTVGEAHQIIDKFREKLINMPLLHEGEELRVKFSAGIAEYPGSIEDMLKRADVSLYQAKNTGKNQVVCYSQ